MKKKKVRVTEVKKDRQTNNFTILRGRNRGDDFNFFAFWRGAVIENRGVNMKFLGAAAFGRDRCRCCPGSKAVQAWDVLSSGQSPLSQQPRRVRTMFAFVKSRVTVELFQKSLFPFHFQPHLVCFFLVHFAVSEHLMSLDAYVR